MKTPKIKRAVSFALSFVLVFCLMAPILTESSRADTLYFTAINDTLLELNDATMPFWQGDMMYVPSTVFSNGELGISYAYDSSGKKAMLYRGDTALLFDIANGSAITESSVSYAFDAKMRSGYVYFPLTFVCAYFLLSCNIIETDYIPVVRIKSSASVLRDNVFVVSADPLMSGRYTRYIQSKQPSTAPTTQTPSAGDSTGAADSQATTDTTQQEETKTDGTVCLGYIVSDADRCGRILDYLKNYSYKATFFFGVDTLTENDDLVRRVVAEGHAVGFVIDSSKAVTEAVSQLDDMNDLLRIYAAASSRIVLGEDSAELSAAGYRVWKYNIDGRAVGTTATGRSSGLITRMAARPFSKVLMNDDEITVSATSGLLSLIRTREWTVRSVNEVNCG